MPQRPPVIAEDEVQAAALSMRRLLGIENDGALGSQANDPAMLADSEMRKRYLEEVAKEKARRERVRGDEQRLAKKKPK